ncbi:CoA-binding protein [Zhihengliuella sp.]|uniref:CoA-binding protein n=1 Tax=Zhihengliuella sp. TaxID=1954483 RepID=UPI002812283B|nr:CoA-binding protein [Zhihengliuella sp.]
MDAAAGDGAHDRWPGSDDAVVRRLLTTPGRWAVVGLTANPRRVAPGVARWLREARGMEIVPVNLAGEDVLGEPGYRRLADVPGRIDVVDCFVNSQRVGDVVDQAIAAGASAVWLQLGVVDHAAAERARAAGLDVVMDTCPLIEAPRLGL